MKNFTFSTILILLFSFQFFAQEPSLEITKFVLVNADNDMDIKELFDGEFVDIRTLSTTHLDIRIETSADVESVGLSLSGIHNVHRTESLPPYALFQDLPIGDYRGHEFETGIYSLTVTPYSADNGTGEMGVVETLNFNVIDGYPFSFITTWKTDEDGDTFDNQIRIPTHVSETYNYTVAWGDGSFDTEVTSEITHTYDAIGTYTVSITGDFPRIWFGSGALNDFNKILSVEQWGHIEWTSMANAFTGCGNLDIDVVLPPDLSRVTDVSGMFAGCSSLVGNGFLNIWDVSNVTNMQGMFQGATMFNQRISRWDVSNVTNMGGMFRDASSFDQDLGDLDVSNTVNMLGMFNGIALSTYNYDNLLKGWSNLPSLQSGLNFSGGNSQYCLGDDARQNIIDTYGWTITDGGESTDCIDPKDFPLRINTGGEEVTYNGEIYMEDAYFDIGRKLNRPQTGLPEPYQSFRFSPSQQMSYDIPLADGEYTVNLHFAELWFGATGGGIGGVGKRIFDVNIEGQLVEDNLDVYAEVGPEAMLVKSHTVMVTGGVLDIDFSSLEADGGERHPIINAIEIVISDRPFVTTRSTYEKQIEVYAGGKNYNFTVDWGDGSSDTGVTDNIIHTYAEDGNYQIAISGSYPRVNIFWDEDRHRGQLVSVDQWGTVKWNSMEYAFSVNHSFEIRAQDVPDLSQVESMKGMFDHGGLTINEKIKEWDVSNVTDMGGMFVYTDLNHDLGSWDVSNVTNMAGMFANTALSTENYDATLIGWGGLPSLQNDVNFDAGNSVYCLGQAARQKLISDYGWTITDGGLNCFFGRLSVVEFVLVNADTEEDLFTIIDGMTIDMRYLQTQNLDIRAETGSKTESVDFDLDGAQSIMRGESIPPYALFQDLPIGDYIGHEFAIGRYFLSATPYSENGLKGDAGDNLSISFEFVDSSLTVSSFTLIDAATDTPLFDLADDLYLTLDDIPSLFLDIRANTSDDVESVRLELTGQQSTVRTESLEPYALFRDLPIGDYIGNNFDLGSYTVTATPYSGDNLTGEMGTPLSMNFRILESNPVLEVTSFTLIDPATDAPLFDLTEDMVITLDDIPSLLLSIRANTTENVNSVRIGLSGSGTTAYFDDVEPYALSEYNGDYYGVNFISGGIYKVTAIPFLGNDQDSKMGISLSVDFEIVDTGSSSKQVKRMVIAPNPAVASTTLSFETPVQLREIQVFDVMGRLVHTYIGEDVRGADTYILNVNGLPAGTYFINSYDAHGKRYQKQMVVKRQ